MAFPELPDDRRARPRRYRGGDAPEHTGRRRAQDAAPEYGNADEQDWLLGAALQQGVPVNEGQDPESAGREDRAGRALRTRHASEYDEDHEDDHGGYDDRRSRPRRRRDEDPAGSRYGRHGGRRNGDESEPGNGYAPGRNGVPNGHHRAAAPDPGRAGTNGHGPANGHGPEGPPGGAGHRANGRPGPGAHSGAHPTNGAGRHGAPRNGGAPGPDGLDALRARYSEHLGDSGAHQVPADPPRPPNGRRPTGDRSWPPPGRPRADDAGDPRPGHTGGHWRDAGPPSGAVAGPPPARSPTRAPGHDAPAGPRRGPGDSGQTRYGPPDGDPRRVPGPRPPRGRGPDEPPARTGGHPRRGPDPRGPAHPETTTVFGTGGRPGVVPPGAPGERPRRRPVPDAEAGPDEDVPYAVDQLYGGDEHGPVRRRGPAAAGLAPDTGVPPGYEDEDERDEEENRDTAAATADDGPSVGKRVGPVGAGARLMVWAGLRKDADGEKRQLSFWKELLLLGAVAFLLTILIQTFLAKVYVIPSGSMETTLHGCSGCNNDRVLVDKVTYNFTDISPGDVVVFRGTDGWAAEVPSDAGSSNPLVRGLQGFGSLVGLAPPDEKDFVKRVIAVGGQTVACCDALNQVMVDGQPLEEPYVYYLPEAGPARQIPFGPITVPEGEYWMMGDSRNNSADSRAAGHGPIPEANVIGKARLIVLPFDRFGRIDSFDPQTSATASAVPGLPGTVPLALGMMGTVPFALGRRRLLAARAEAERFLPATRRPPRWRRRT
ncbi:signal peptidase I [Pseudonocardia nematodicida]|uniref:Signal peptidase I n=1 Tax=Pseudonocardia nematodicida TaxID=1206997 RepID=A0ABV1KK73_9PSEU